MENESPQGFGIFIKVIEDFFNYYMTVMSQNNPFVVLLVIGLTIWFMRWKENGWLIVLFIMLLSVYFDLPIIHDW